MSTTYLTTEELSARIKYDPRTIREQMKDRPVPPSLPDCLPPSVNNGSATRALQHSRNTPALHLSPKAAARSIGSTGDCNAPHSYARHSSNGQQKRSPDPSGPALTIASNALRDVHVRPPYVP